MAINKILIRPQAPAAYNGEWTGMHVDSSDDTLKIVKADGTVRQVPPAAISGLSGKTIVDGSATSLFDVACASGAMSGGTIAFLVRAFDGTEYQAIGGYASYAIVNKAGTCTGTITYATANEAKIVTSGTLTLAFTIVAGTSKMTVKVQPTGSLTETTPYTIEFVVTPIRGAVTVL